MKRTGAAAQAVDGITDYIKRHRLKPGDPLPTETKLCEELGFSRSSVREAVRILSSLDVVEVRHGHGTYVGAMSLSPLVAGMVLRITLDSKNSLARLRDVVETRVALDLSMAEELVENFRDVDVEQLRELVCEMRAQFAAGKSFATEDRAFHSTLQSRISNVLIRELSDAFWQVHMDVLPLMEVSMPEDIEQTIEAHEALIDALSNKDVEQYRRVVTRHYAPLLRAIASHVPSPDTPESPTAP
ncbi:FadR/GntR family transcriptional regulator [Corynebacterium phocae]|uniref:FadR/GntR family transcriptional regulator n=1 Tax=Corynebacterium phocae TaxID=161895 RepID=UPI00095252B1|nr:FadR/GntR family transcriptional regulator [Corynebacterium phocae]KAA8725388.1 FadR family transcriptional regulator [Corynebacterium phocae]